MAAVKSTKKNGSYKIGGISDFLSFGKDKNECRDEAKGLSNLFSGKSVTGKEIPATAEAVVAVSESSGAKKLDEEVEETEPAVDKAEGDEEVERDDVPGAKRKRVGERSSNEPYRKKQRDNRKKYKSNKEDDDDKIERLARTVFVGNIPVSATRKELKLLFSTCGKVESARLRSIPVASPNLSKKLAMVKKEFHPERDTMNAYVVFENKEDVKNALALKGAEFKGMHIRVDTAVKKEINNRLSVFVGNLPFNSKEEDVREHFSQCGEVDDVRIIKDKKSGIGKGFGYVTFKEKESVSFAVKLQNSNFNGRKIRVFHSVDKNDVKKPFNKKKDRQFRMKVMSARSESDGKRNEGSLNKGRKTVPGFKGGEKKKQRDFKKNGMKLKSHTKKKGKPNMPRRK